MVSAESMSNKKLLIRANPIYSSPTPKIKLAQDYLNAGNLPIAISLLKEIIASLNEAPNSAEIEGSCHQVQPIAETLAPYTL